jgi:hypothetical protein
MKVFMPALMTILMVALLVLPPYALGGEPAGYCAIVHDDSPQRQGSRNDLERIFLGKKTLSSTGERILPILLAINDPTVEEFMRDVLQRSPMQYRAYWRWRLFSGGGTPPQIFGTQDEILSFMKNRPNAIAIVARTAELDGNCIEITD